MISKYGIRESDDLPDPPDTPRCMYCGRFVPTDATFVIVPDSAFTTEDCGHLCASCDDTGAKPKLDPNTLTRGLPKGAI